MKKIENYFVNKEIRAFHFCKNLKRIILQTYTRKILHITKVSGKTSNPSCQKKNFSERINLTREANLLITNCDQVAKELNNFFVNAVKNFSIPNYENSDSLAENIDPILRYC